MPQLIKEKEAATELGLDLRAMARLRLNGQIKHYRIHRMIRYSREDVIAYKRQSDVESMTKSQRLIHQIREAIDGRSVEEAARLINTFLNRVAKSPPIIVDADVNDGLTFELASAERITVRKREKAYWLGGPHARSDLEIIEILGVTADWLEGAFAARNAITTTLRQIKAFREKAEEYRAAMHAGWQRVHSREKSIESRVTARTVVKKIIASQRAVVSRAKADALKIATREAQSAVAQEMNKLSALADASLPFTQLADGMVPESIRQVPGLRAMPMCLFSPGVYFLVRANQVVYVGQARCITSRLPAHRDKQFDRAFWLPVPMDQLDHVERRYIRLLKPPLNRDAWSRKQRSRLT